MCWGNIWRVNLKHNLGIHFLAAAAVVMLTPVLFGIHALSARASMTPLERMLPFMGTILLTPVFMPEENEGIRDVVRVKRVSYLSVCLLRVVSAVAAIALLTAVFTAVMKYCACDVGWQQFVGSFASSVFLGTAGFAVAGISNSAPAGYMASVLYYILNMGVKDELGPLYLFSMSAGGSVDEKYWLLEAALLLIVSTLVVVKRRLA